MLLNKYIKFWYIIFSIYICVFKIQTKIQPFRNTVNRQIMTKPIITYLTLHNELYEVHYTISGKFYAQTYETPAEYPEIDIEKIIFEDEDVTEAVDQYLFEEILDKLYYNEKM